MNRQFRYKYTYNPDNFGSPSHSWAIIGKLGAVELNVKELKDYGVSGGIEVHSRFPTSDKAPSHDECHLLHQPCWHDGSSLWVEEHIKPDWRFPESPEDHRMMFDHLEIWYNDKFPIETEGREQ